MLEQKNKYFDSVNTYSEIAKKRLAQLNPLNYISVIQDFPEKKTDTPKQITILPEREPEKKETTLKDIKYDHVEGLSDRILGFLELCRSIPSLASKIKITSGYRPGSKTSNGKDSNHSKGDAIDLIPAYGSFDDLAKEIFLHPEILQYLKDNKLGIIDETNPATMMLTGATGKHWHVGPDKIGISGVHSLLTKYGYA